MEPIHPFLRERLYPADLSLYLVKGDIVQGLCHGEIGDSHRDRWLSPIVIAG